MALPTTTEVLIVGGGPTGLVLALALQKNQCSDVVVVDSVLQGESTSRALAVHAATMEALDTIGCADLLTEQGNEVSRTRLWIGRGEEPVQTTFFTPLSKYTKYPFILTVPQHVTEKVLCNVAQERGIKVHRPHKVVNMRPNQEDRTLTDVIFEDGHIIRARCVVGADGARSTIRRLTNVTWTDPNGEARESKELQPLSNMIIADVTLSSLPPSFGRDSLNVVISDETRFFVIPLPGCPYPEQTTDPVYRITCGVPLKLGEPPHAPDTAYIQKIVDAWGPNVVLSTDAPRIEITRTVWSSRFRTHSSIAETFFTHAPGGAGPVLLLGDAAHIHPPTGGQGMNLGIRDGIKLGPILAEFIARTAASTTGLDVPRDEAEAPLRTWAEARRKRALAVIALVNGMNNAFSGFQNRRTYLLGVLPYNPGWLRLRIFRFLTSFERFRVNSAWRVSGLGDP